MAREKGMGNLQMEKGGRWTIRIGYAGRRLARATGTRDRDKAEKMLMRLLAPLGRGERRLPLADVWCAYLRSPNRRDLAQATLASKQMAWMHFAGWMENVHPEIGSLAEVTADSVAEYLAEFRLGHCATTYNNRVCILREIFHVLAAKAGLADDPWSGVRLRPGDVHARRELSVEELKRLLEAAVRADLERKSLRSGDAASSPRQSEETQTSAVHLHPSPAITEWHTLFLLGIYTGLRLGDCCCLRWDAVDLARGIIQVIPAKTRRHAHGRPVTIPIHPALEAALRSILERRSLRSGDAASSPRQSEDPKHPLSADSLGLLSSPSTCVLPTVAATYRAARWRVSEAIAKIFKAAAIEMHAPVEGRARPATEASFHSLRHTFVSFAANAGIPLAVVQSIVGHSSSLMTRHYYHESESALRSAIAALPTL